MVDTPAVPSSTPAAVAAVVRSGRAGSGSSNGDLATKKTTPAPGLGTATPLARAVAGKTVTDAPPFWSRHGRTNSSVSVVSYQSIGQARNGQILLEDHSEEHHEQSQACWAKSVSIDEYVVVSGPSGIGAYVVWHCTVSTLKGGNFPIRKRYSEFDQLRIDLVNSFPHAAPQLPQLPRKSVVSRFRPKFLEQRKQGLEHFLNCVLLNPEFAASPVLKEFIFS